MSRTLFWWAFGLTAALKLLAAAVVPLTGDEAYFVTWALHPALGYYDHGPMTAWLLAPFLALGQTTWLVRLPAVLVPLAAGVAIRGALRPLDAEKADLAGTLFLLSPANALNILYTTDTPLLLFSALAGVSAFRAARRDDARGWFLAGLFLGGAVLSKYLAVLLGLALVVAILAGRARGVAPRPWAALAALAAGAFPALAVNIVWNAQHGWANVLFTLQRNADATFSLVTAAAFVGVAAALAGPGLLVLFLGRRTPRKRTGPRLPGALLFGTLAGVPAAALFAISFFQRVGLHWLLSSFPFAVAVLAVVHDGGTLRRMLRPTAIYSGVLLALAAVLASAPVELLRGRGDYASVVFGVHADEVLDALEPLAAGRVLASPSYARAALLGFHAREHVVVLGPGSHHGRQDDLLTDLRLLDGKDILLLAKRPADVSAARPLFRAAATREIAVRGARWTVLLGDGFRYPVYRETVLREVARRYYTIPTWLEPLRARCPFRERYALDDATRGGAPSGRGSASAARRRD